MSQIVEYYQRLRKRGAFIEQYKKESLFSDNLDEFDHSWYIYIYIYIYIWCLVK